MKVRVRLFAVAREIAGVESIDVTVAEAATAQNVLQAVGDQVPALEHVVANSILAVDGNLAAREMIVPPAAEVALIPPVSGG